MADLRKALDDKTRKLSGKKVEEGKEHAAYQETQQQLLAIQAEQQQNLAVARAESKASFENNQTLAQAAELGAISAAEAEQAAQAGGQVTLNPATQSVLAKYGAGQPKFTRTSSHSQQVTKQNITINNNITSNTTNDVKVPAGVGGPLQGRPLQFKDPSTASAAATSSTNKFKTWISSAFARQNEEGAKRDREYRHRENSLAKSASKMMKKLEDIGKTIGTRMDPRKIGSTWQSQLKTLLLLFGFGYLSSNWTKILDGVSKIERWVSDTWSYFTGNVKEGGKTFVSDIKSFLGGKDNETVFDSLYNLFLGEDGFWGRFKDYFHNAIEDRKSAISMVKFPEINLDDMISTVKGVGEYLGNILTAMISGTEGTKSIISNQIKAVANKGAFEQAAKDNDTRDTVTMTTEDGSRIDADLGAKAILSGKYEGLTRYSLDNNGELTTKYGAESTIAQASDISRLYKLSKTGEVKSTELSAGIQRLYNSAKTAREDGSYGVPVTPKLLNDFFTPEEQASLQNSNDLRKSSLHVVLRKKTEDDYAIEEADPLERATKNGVNRYLYNQIPVVSTADAWLRTGEGAAAGAVMGSVLPGVGTAAGAVAGGLVGLVSSTEAYQAASGYLGGLYNRAMANDYRVEYVSSPRPGDKKVIDKKTGKPALVTVWRLSDKGIQKLTDKITGKENTNIDMEDENFVTSIQEGLSKTAAESLEEDLKKRKEIKDNFLLQNNQQIQRVNEKELAATRQKIEDLKNGSSIDYDLKQAYNQKREFDKGRAERGSWYEERHTDDRVAKMGNNIKEVVQKATDTAVEVGKKAAETVGIKTGSNSESEINKEVTNIKTQNLSEVQKKRAKYAVKRLMDEGLSKSQASGIVGNMIKESRLDPTLGHTDNNNKHAGGIVQWNGPRYNAAKKYFGKPVEQVSFHDQLEYVIKELKGEVGDGAAERSGFLKKHGFKEGDKILDVMKSTTSLQDSTDTFERVFEGSGDFDGYWIYNKKGEKVRRVNGDRNKSRHELAATVYKLSGGDLSDTNFEYEKKEDNSQITTGNPTTPSTQPQESNEPAEERSFLSILKDEATKLISSFGGIFSGGDNEETKEQTREIEPEAITPANQETKSSPTIEPVSVPSLGEINIAKSVREDTQGILEKYTKAEKQENLKIAKAISPKVNPIITPNINSGDPLRLIDSTKSIKNPTNTFDNIAKNIIEVKKGVNSLIELTAINGNILTENLSAVDRGTAINANSSTMIAQAAVRQDQNSVRTSVSLDEINNSSIKSLG